MNPEQFYQALAQEGIVLNDRQKKQFDQYYQLLVEWNQKMNLTAITDRDDVYLKHFFDSLQLIKGFDFATSEHAICDVGAGAGFPSLPLKIVYPHLRVTVVDSLNKRITFLNTLIEQLGLDHVKCYHDRAETFGQNSQFRGQFDIVTARAVAKLSVLSELCMPLVKKQGYFIALKASHSDVELTEAQKAIATLGGKVEADHRVMLPCDAGERHIICIKKTKETPKMYPRKPGVPVKKPL